jgi:flagellar motor switch protein FliN/FliY
VLVLDRSALQPVDLLLEGHVVARGQLVAVGSQFAVRLTELPVSLNTGLAGTV